MQLTSQLFTEIRKDPTADRFYLEAREVELFCDYPEPNDDDWSLWNSIEAQDLPEEVLTRWIQILKDYNVPYIHSLEVSPETSWWYIHRWQIGSDKKSFLSLPYGKIFVNGHNMLDKDWMPCPEERIQVKAETVWQGYKMPTKNIIQSCVFAYKLGRSQRTKEITEFLSK